jgi:hypothetical protein
MHKDEIGMECSNERLTDMLLNTGASPALLSSPKFGCVHHESKEA